jgi:hypothetical protein
MKEDVKKAVLVSGAACISTSFCGIKGEVDVRFLSCGVDDSRTFLFDDFWTVD